MNKKAIILLSGGIDSTTLLAQLHHQKYEITALCFNYNQKHKIEIEYSKRNAERYNVKEFRIIEIAPSSFITSGLVSNDIDLNKYEEDNLPSEKENSYVPYRNMIFLSYALSFAESNKIDEIYIGVNKDDAKNFWDCSEDFIMMINSISKFNTNIEVKAPLLKFTKSEIINLAFSLSVDLENTISCYEPVNGKECRCCLSCKKKEFAVTNAKQLTYR